MSGLEQFPSSKQENKNNFLSEDNNKNTTEEYKRLYSAIEAKKKELAYVLDGIEATLSQLDTIPDQGIERELKDYRVRRDKCLAELDHMADRHYQLYRDMSEQQRREIGGGRSGE